ncbi:hypothetical protein [Mucilaginibacter polytrichastri]|uniref:Uncharacterized protein n=1 Tax=Mucilaginibacter polytrichastri TaxID=1302689 RepID=A0A1Q6A160_9SPHI|nr:hypothetical protein [Mucilaginibacter polytrichastri]OKS87712.1 hypothetical protein RG47T_3174 [Mucilaginibacter polytrichastri]SFT20033.1 hypothetical protein SAMN04487890_11648 [Mucilaginibacter polytrichastri]
MTRKKIKKRKFALLLIVITMFFAAYAHHKFGNQPVTMGRLQDKLMDETSGMAASAINPDIFYVHNDSGDTSRFFAINAEGKLKATYYYHGMAGGKFGVWDCEDIAVGPGPAKNKSYIYLGDIGDNGATHKNSTIYRFNEPKITAKDSVSNINAAVLYLKYPDGPRDAETLMVDPLEKLLYIVSKRQDSVTVYTTPLLFKNGDTVTLTKQCRLYFKGLRPLRWITAGDISADGKQILLKSYVNVYYWQRQPGETVWQAMLRKPKELPYEQEHQGEAIAFTRDGKAYLTTSEGVYAPIYKYFIPAN